MCVGTVDVKATYAQSQLKGEDVMLMPTSSLNTSCIGNCLVFSICDGHASDKASVFAGKNIERILQQNIDQDQLEYAHQKGFEEVARVFRECMRKSFAQLDREFLQKYDCIAGSTVSILVVYGRLVTIANIGDSRAILVTPNGAVQELTVDHRIHDNKQERQRMIANGADISMSEMALKFGGILRIWPGGLALSRSMGDEMCKPHVVSDPHITQIILPEDSKAKIIMASDGLWDDLSNKEVAKISQKTKLSALPQRLIRKSIKACGGGLLDDTSVMAISFKANQTEKNKNTNCTSNINFKLSKFFNFKNDTNKSKTHAYNKNNNNSGKNRAHFAHVGKNNKVHVENELHDVPQGFSMISQDMRIPILRMDTLLFNQYRYNRVANQNSKIFDFDLNLSVKQDIAKLSSSLSTESELSEDLCFERFNVSPTKLIRKNIKMYY
eukprot:TRINITY_DN11015_c0_g3_i1.p1 TRINITY_DN11015_c0_g3~~TRINITY_DN11015_c0_g3_i1.p1  ORF type:complete len:491 (-),score=32.70 TRINITY_DN11015_c0_g3_i1:623-1942(-)